MDTTLILQYLTDLEFHNERPWYHAHKAEQQAANGAFLEFLQELMARLSTTDAAALRFEPKKLTFRLARDMRYAKDGLPYHTAFRAHIGPEGKAFLPTGYYIHLSPGGRSFLAGGIYASWFKEVTDRIRRAIDQNPDEWLAIVSAPRFTKYFEVRGETLKNVPREYDKDHPLGQWLKFKSWYIETPVPDALVADAPALLDYAVDACEAMQPFNAFLNRAIEGFVPPERHRS